MGESDLALGLVLVYILESVFFSHSCILLIIFTSTEDQNNFYLICMSITYFRKLIKYYPARDPLYNLPMFYRKKYENQLLADLNC